LRPRALFAGIGLSFLVCCLAGHWAGHQNLYRDFERLHFYLMPSSLFYPTASQLRALGEARLKPEKVTVIVGSSSILFGTGQTMPEVWSQKLQAELGDDYQVLNLAIGGASPQEIGAIAAEIIGQTHPKLIFVGSVAPAQMAGDIDGNLYKYFFWDAYYKGMLIPDQGRQEKIDALLASREYSGVIVPDKHPWSLGPRGEELLLQARLDSQCRYCDLWNTVGYRYVFTAYSQLAADHWYLPRKAYPDPEKLVPVAERYPARVFEVEMGTVRSRLIEQICVRDKSGHWVANQTSGFWQNVETGWRNAFPDRFHNRTLMLPTHESPYYVKRLTADEQERYDVVMRATEQCLLHVGYPTLIVGAGYCEDDFRDRCHFSESGGARLAREVAPAVRRLARELGYLDGGQP
jgi:lysophospholipase L1-like esterase